MALEQGISQSPGSPTVRAADRDSAPNAAQEQLDRLTVLQNVSGADLSADIYIAEDFAAHEDGIAAIGNPDIPALVAERNGAGGLDFVKAGLESESRNAATVADPGSDRDRLDVVDGAQPVRTSNSDPSDALGNGTAHPAYSRIGARPDITPSSAAANGAGEQLDLTPATELRPVLAAASAPLDSVASSFGDAGPVQASNEASDSPIPDDTGADAPGSAPGSAVAGTTDTGGETQSDAPHYGDALTISTDSGSSLGDDGGSGLLVDGSAGGAYSGGGPATDEPSDAVSGDTLAANNSGDDVPAGDSTVGSDADDSDDYAAGDDNDGGAHDCGCSHGNHDGDDRGHGLSGNDVVYGTAEGEHLVGGACDDELYGDGGDDRLTGSAGDDLLFGGAGDDRLDGDAGDDGLQGDAGNDTLRGGAGEDTAVFSGTLSEYTFAQNKDGSYTVQDTVEGRDGTDTVTGVEFLQFSDQTVAADTLSGGTASNKPGQSVPGMGPVESAGGIENSNLAPDSTLDSVDLVAMSDNGALGWDEAVVSGAASGQPDHGYSDGAKNAEGAAIEAESPRASDDHHALDDGSAMSVDHVFDPALSNHAMSESAFA